MRQYLFDNRAPLQDVEILGAQDRQLGVYVETVYRCKATQTDRVRWGCEYIEVATGEVGGSVPVGEWPQKAREFTEICIRKLDATIKHLTEQRDRLRSSLREQTPEKLAATPDAKGFKGGLPPQALRAVHEIWEDPDGMVIAFRGPKYRWSFWDPESWRDIEGAFDHTVKLRPWSSTWEDVEAQAATQIGVDDAKAARPKKTVNTLYPLLGVIGSPRDHWQTYSDAFEAGMKARPCTFRMDEEGPCYSACHAQKDGDCYDAKCPQKENRQNHCPLDKLCRFHGERP